VWQVAIEVGIGLGVFAGTWIGIDSTVRALSASALRKVLQEDTFKSIQLVVLSLPVFNPQDNFFTFQRMFRT